MCRKFRLTYPFFLLGPILILGLILISSMRAHAAELQIDRQLKRSPKVESADALTSKSMKGEKPVPVVRDQRVLDAAKMYEKYFLGQMMKAMRSTVNRSELEKQSMGEGIYREQLDDQYVDSWGDKGGIGLADMIHDELVGKAEMMKLRRQAMKSAKGKARTPMALTDRDVMKVRKLPSVKSSGADGASPEMVETVLVSLGKTTARSEDGPESVRSPWTGKITKLDTSEGKVVMGIEPGVETAVTNGDAKIADLGGQTAGSAPHKVELAFDGVPFEVHAGDVIKAGQTVGHLGKSARGILLRQTTLQTLVQEANKPSPRAGL